MKKLKIVPAADQTKFQLFLFDELEFRLWLWVVMVMVVLVVLVVLAVVMVAAVVGGGSGCYGLEFLVY